MDFLINKIKLKKTKGLSTETETPKVDKVMPMNRLSAKDLIDLRTTYLESERSAFFVLQLLTSGR